MISKVAASDRRAFPRFRADMTVEIVRPDHSNAEPVAGTLLDISQSGALVQSTTMIPDGEWIVIRPDPKGAGFGAELTAIVHRNLTSKGPHAQFACRFPQPVEYSALRLFM